MHGDIDEQTMQSIVAFFKPTKIKLLFLVEWLGFILLTAAQGELNTKQQLLVAGYPLGFFYLVACALTAFSVNQRPSSQTRILLGYALGLTILDQVAKTIVVASVPYQTSIPIVNNWLHLAHERNFHGSWIASVFKVQSTSVIIFGQWLIVVLLLLCAPLFHRFYISTYRKSFWVNLVFVGVLAGFFSWACDMILRGYIVDYLGLPDLVTADFKDIWVAIGTAAFFAETLDNPNLSWSWLGWQKERDALIRLAKSFCRFSIQEVRKLSQSIRIGKN